MPWRGLALYKILPVGHGMAYGIALRDMAWDMILPGGHGMIYGMAWRGMAWYIVWPDGHGMVYNKAWPGMAWYVEMIFILWHCLGPVHMWRSRCHRPKAGYRPPSPPGGILYTMIS